jgi:hypothetical protein
VVVEVEMDHDLPGNSDLEDQSSRVVEVRKAFLETPDLEGRDLVEDHIHDHIEDSSSGMVVVVVDVDVEDVVGNWRVEMEAGCG